MNSLYSIQEFTKILEQKGCHITRNKLRHYEREGLVRPIRQKREERDRWYYTDEDVEIVIAITNLISLSWKAKEVSALLRLSQEVSSVVEKMQKTKELLFNVFTGNAKVADIRDQAELNEIEFWKTFEGGFPLDNVRKIIGHYTPGLDMHTISVATHQMLNKMENGIAIVSKYNEKLIKNQDEIMKLQQEIYGVIKDIKEK